MQGPKVRINIKIISGPTRVEMRVVNHGELNQDSNYPWFCSLSFFLFVNPSLTLAMESFTTPEWST